MAFAQKFLDKGAKVIDVSGDFRFKDVEIYEKWYKREHTAKNLIEKSAYGLPELFRDEIKGKDLIANPGCYPTAAILSITPLLKNGYATDFIIDAKTGITGAGRKASQANLFAERNEAITPYKTGYMHKHAPEMEAHSERKTGLPCRVVFTPQVVPMNRGILETIYVKLLKDTAIAKIISLYKEFYANNPFIHILENSLPSTKDVYLTNNVHIGFTLEERTNTLIVAAAIDNLIKGASGQAVQNMNIIFNLPEETGLM
jgi:N-acetyl-gamma-glutamyl-phosphate reductase